MEGDNKLYELNKWTPIASLCRKSILTKVFKYVNGIAPTGLSSFVRLSHTKNTRNNNVNLKLPSIKTERGRRTFLFQGSKVFNDLPTNIKSEESLIFFKKKLEEHFKC